MKKWLGLVLCMVGLAACDFHLRGYYEIPGFMQHLTVKTPPDASTTLRPELLLALQTAGIDTNGGNFTLEVVHDNLVKQTSALVTQTEVSEITLVYDVEYRLRYASGHAASDARHLLLRRGYQYDPTSIIGKTTEEDTLTSELRSDAVQQILRQLSALREDALLPDADPATVPAR
jgi:LPS-assembly lipoprotein